MPSPPRDRAIHAPHAVTRARAFLGDRQERSGLWCDYGDLPPGPSDAWTTAFAAWAMRPGLAQAEGAAAFHRAASALRGLARSEGWGYNARTAVDADSSAWCVRVLAAGGGLSGIDGVAVLMRFIGECGAARTFSSAERFGRWSAPHAEVTPLVGLALQAAGAGAAAIDRLRRATLGGHQSGSGWPTFWWTTPAYAIARNLEFLAATGGIPGDIHAAEVQRLSRQPPASSAVECAECLVIACHLQHPAVDDWGSALLDQQDGSGGWLPSCVLCVPAQHGPAARTVHADGRGVFSTAAALSALRLWAA